MFLCTDSVTRGTNVTFEFEFGDGTEKIVSDVVSSQARTVTQTHVYSDGEHYSCFVVYSLDCTL